MLLQNSRSVPWLVLGSAARHGDHSTSDPPPGTPRSSWRQRTHNPSPKFSCFELTTVVTPHAHRTQARGQSPGGLCRFDQNRLRYLARVACALFSLPAPDQRKCRRRTTGLLKRSRAVEDKLRRMCVSLIPSEKKQVRPGRPGDVRSWGTTDLPRKQARFRV